MHIQMILKVIQTVMTKIIQDLGLENQLKEGMQFVEWSTRSHHSKKTIEENKIRKLVVLDKIQTWKEIHF